MKKIIWLVNDEIPNVGKAKVGKSVTIDNKLADEFIERGLATDGRISKKEKAIIAGGENK